HPHRHGGGGGRRDVGEQSLRRERGPEPVHILAESNQGSGGRVGGGALHDHRRAVGHRQAGTQVRRQGRAHALDHLRHRGGLLTGATPGGGRGGGAARGRGRLRGREGGGRPQPFRAGFRGAAGEQILPWVTDQSGDD